MRTFVKVEPFVEDGRLMVKTELIEEKEDFLDMCYRELDCRCIDIITPEEFPENFYMIVDDEFLPVDKLPNIWATIMYGAQINGAVLIGKDLVEPDGIRTVGLDEIEALAFVMTYFN